MKKIKVNKLFHKNIINNVSYEFLIQNKYIIEGKNGSGKTTLVNLIMNNIRKKSGSIELVDNCKVGFLPQNSQFLKNITIAKQLELLNINGKEISNKISQKTGFTLEKYPDQYSGGEKQIIKVLFLLYQKYDINIFDEPFNNLSPERSQIVIDELKKKNSWILIDHQNNMRNNGDVIKLKMIKGELYE